MNSDSHYAIGKTHKVCQDYALHKDLKDCSYVIVSDGCSGSPNTDIGARLLSLGLSWHMDYLEDEGIFDPYNTFNYNDEFSIYKAIQRSVNSVKNKVALDILDQSYDATLLSLYIKNNQYSYFCFGDGLIVRLHSNGTITATSVEYPSGAPYYLNYELDPEIKSKYAELYGSRRIIREHIIGSKDYYYSWVSDTRDGATYPFVAHGNTEGLVAMVVMTDGALSFSELINKEKRQISLEKILRNLMDFKGYAGEFVYRRMHKFEKECKELGWEHSDDLSMGVIHL